MEDLNAAVREKQKGSNISGKFDIEIILLPPNWMNPKYKTLEREVLSHK